MMTGRLRLGIAVGTILSVPMAARGEERNGGLFGSNLLCNSSFEDYYTPSGPEFSDGETVQHPLQTDQSSGHGVQCWANAGYDVCSIRTDGHGAGHSGHFYGMGGRFPDGFGEISRMRQDIDLLACGFLAGELDGDLLVMSTGGYLSSWPGDADSVGLSVTFLDSTSTRISTGYSTGQRHHDAWAVYGADDLSVPAGTRFVRFEVEFEKVQGTNSDGRIDDVWVRISRVDSLPAEFERNLLANPGFEAHTSGWTVSGGNPRVRADGADRVPARSGGFLLFGGQQGLSVDGGRATLLQEIVLSDYGFSAKLIDDPAAALFVQVGGWLYGGEAPPLAKAGLRCEIRDAAGEVLGDYSSGRVRSAAPLLRRAELALPPGARKLTFRYDALDPPDGETIDGYLDDAFVRITANRHQRDVCGPAAVAHRGNSIIAPENTLAAILATHGQADLVEFDVRQCASGELVVVHDSTVERTTDGAGAVADLRFDELRLLDAGSWFSPDFAGEKIPTLGEAISSTPLDVVPLVERKTGSATAYVAALQALGVQYEVIVQSFDWDFLAAVHNLDAQIRLAALGSGSLTPETLLDIQAAGAQTVSWASQDVTATEVDLVQGTGLALLVWTVNEPSRIESFIAYGVDGIISDDPAAVRWRSDPFFAGGDFDRDGDVDADDYRAFTDCLTGPDTFPDGQECAVFDFQCDGDVDLDDYGKFAGIIGR